jgi:hypothetical protein
MSSDWIKMRVDLFTHPKVVRMASALKADTLRTVGGLMSVWSVFDAHTEDGKMEGYDFQTLDDLLRWPGFSEAMSRVGWLHASAQGVELPNFGEHNGQSARRRGQEAKRKKDVRNVSASDADVLRTRVEKRTEEKKDQNKPPAEEAKARGPNPDLLGDPLPVLVKPSRILTPKPPYQAIIDLYHGILCPPLSQCLKITPVRERNIAKCWKDDFQDLENWQTYFEFCKSSEFLMGRAAPTEGRSPFKADIDFLINPTNIVKVIERKYHS